MPKKPKVNTRGSTRSTNRRTRLVNRTAPPPEYCKTCTHLKTDHKFAKPGDTYTAAKMYSWGPAATIEVQNFNGYCGHPLCTCIQFITGGAKEDYENHQRHLGELAERIRPVEFPTMRQAGEMPRQHNSSLRKKKGAPTGERTQSLF